MTKRKGKAELVDLKALLAPDEDYLRTMIETIVQATTLEAEMTAVLGAEKNERTASSRRYTLAVLIAAARSASVG